ncbi:MAG: hypothetical protein QOI61_1019, partial [Actinomycetota bacterium]
AAPQANAPVNLDADYGAVVDAITSHLQ